MHIIDEPRFISRDTYESLITKIARTLSDSESVRSIYQVGSIKHPGISDLDLVCIFKGQAAVETDIRQQLNQDEHHILTHNLFGIHETRISESFKYSFYTGYRLVSGVNLKIEENPVGQIRDKLKRQIALEFLMKMYITMYTQITYRTIKLRAFLLEAKAISFDLDLLKIEQHPLAEMVKEVNQWRDEWFTKPPGKKQIVRLFLSFFTSLESLISTEMQKNNFQLPYKETAVSKNILVHSGNTFQMKHNGLAVLSWMPFMNRRLLNLQNRFNTFNLTVPSSTSKQDSLYKERFYFYEHMSNENRRLYPHFTPLSTGIRLWKPESLK